MSGGFSKISFILLLSFISIFQLMSMEHKKHNYSIQKDDDSDEKQCEPLVKKEKQVKIKKNSLEKAMALLKNESYEQNEQKLIYQLFKYIQACWEKEEPIADEHERTLLHHLVIMGKTKLIKILFNLIANRLNTSDDMVYYPFKDPNFAKQCKKYLNQRDTQGNTPLHVAAKNKNIEAVQELLSHGADAAALNKDLQTPDSYATESCTACKPAYNQYCEEHKKVVDLLLQKLYKE